MLSSTQGLWKQQHFPTLVNIGMPDRAPESSLPAVPLHGFLYYGVRPRQCQHQHDLNSGGFLGKRFGFSSLDQWICLPRRLQNVQVIHLKTRNTSNLTYRYVLGTEGLI